MVATQDAASDPSASAAIERLLGRFVGFVPAVVRPFVVGMAREKMLLPPATFAARLRERGFDLTPVDALDVWAAVLWALGDE